MGRSAGAFYPGVVDEVGFVLLPFGVGDGLELVAGEVGDADVDGEEIAVGGRGGGAGFSVPFGDGDLGQGFERGGGPVGEVELVFEPERSGAGDEVGAVAGFGEPPGVEEVGAGAGDCRPSASRVG